MVVIERYRIEVLLGSTECPLQASLLINVNMRYEHCISGIIYNSKKLFVYASSLLQLISAIIFVLPQMYQIKKIVQWNMSFYYR